MFLYYKQLNVQQHIPVTGQMLLQNLSAGFKLGINMPSLQPGRVDRVILNNILTTATALKVGSCAP
jgi:hypothetical protein